MELGELKVFLTVAEERSFSRAAAKLYRTQPAVSQAVRRLEEQLGERLFDRTTKNATLTEAGIVLLREGTRLVRLAEEAAAAVRRQSERGRALLRIAGSEVAAHAVLPLIVTFLSRHANMSIEFRRLPDADVVGEVTTGMFDVGVVAQERVSAPLQQVRVPVAAPGISVLVPKRHPLAPRRSVSMDALQDERLVVLADGSPLEALAAGMPASIIGLPGIDSLKRAVEMGVGVGVVPSSVATSLGPQPCLVAVPLGVACSLNALTLVYRQNDALSSNAARFIEIVRSGDYFAAAQR